MTYPTPEQKFQGLWKFNLEPELRQMFLAMFKEGIVYAVESQEKAKKDKKK